MKLLLGYKAQELAFGEVIKCPVCDEPVIGIEMYDFENTVHYIHKEKDSHCIYYGRLSREIQP